MVFPRHDIMKTKPDLSMKGVAIITLAPSMFHFFILNCSKFAIIFPGFTP